MKHWVYLILTFLCFVPRVSAQWFSKQPSFDSLWSEYQTFPNLKSEAYTKGHFPILKEIEVKENEEYEYYFQICKFQEIRELSEILKLVSFYDALLQIKRCSEANKNEIVTIEKHAKKKIFDLTVFPKLEILTSEITNAEILNLVRNLQIEWEKTVYVYSNFYKPHEVLFLGKEREYTTAINRILYSEMPESKRKLLLLRLLQDMKANQKATYQLFYYSNQNPWNSEDLISENIKSKSYYLEIVSLWKNDPNITDTISSQLNELENCLVFLPKDQLKIRIFGFFGFFSDYGRFSNEDLTQLQRENQIKLQFIRKTIFQSHHFQKRLENVLISCKNSVESQKEL
ncbi:hypothetical protein [Leptospira biflexa]|uniref:hypothetical protein n=1 Tax=Leptospira biflexa TaxID=172 RepID=UPI001082D569|nr:hypothetical protein [Leptospira biflexa]TGM31636.1 hypothetical protein EHQ89_16685 [Leptospira biflexa]TGM39204.1 hypothetical protein EHQ80_04425 [Leptospira biflexa]